MSKIEPSLTIDVVPVASSDLDSSSVGEPPADLRANLMATRLQSLAAANHELHTAIDAERREKQRLNLALTRLQGENTTLRQALEPAYSIGDEVGILSNRMETLTQKIGILNDQSQIIAEQSRTLDHCGQSVAELVERFEALEGVLNTLQTALVELTATRHTSLNDRNEAAEQLHAVLTSFSWRFMAPWRRLGRLLR